MSYALKLETTVMFLLFCSMTFLVAISITSGQLLFFNKIKKDLAAFWILGSSLKDISRGVALFTHLLSFIVCFFGPICAGLFLLLFDYLQIDIMPDIFLEQKIPVYFYPGAFFKAFIIPYIIASLFSFLGLYQFRKNIHQVSEQIKLVGR